jgi:hypothetical protein
MINQYLFLLRRNVGCCVAMQGLQVYDVTRDGAGFESGGLAGAGSKSGFKSGLVALAIDRRRCPTLAFAS